MLVAPFVRLLEYLVESITAKLGSVGVVLGNDGKIAVHACGEKVRANELGTKGMYGGDIRAGHFRQLFFQLGTLSGRRIGRIDSLDQRLAQFFFHLCRCLFRKGNREDFPDIDARSNQPHDFFDHDGGFAAARGSGDDGFSRRGDCGLLLLRKIIHASPPRPQLYGEYRLYSSLPRFCRLYMP